MQIPQWVQDRVIARQGCLHPYDNLPGARTAVVVIDMQQYFTLPGYQGECAAARGIIAPVNRLCDAVRAAGGTVVWVQTASDNADAFWSHHHGVMLTPERSARRLETLRRDSPGFALHPTCGRPTATCASPSASTAPWPRDRRNWSRCCADAAWTRC